ncbi:MAG TPA: hypothetical protein VLX28_10855 [Thermoanaerobaculia bacterium]|nr:hypothetical protein [Thermoanaerobaculia bacterium]
MTHSNQPTAGIKTQLVKTVNPRYPDRDFYLPADDEEVMKKLAGPPAFAPDCAKACTNILTLIPRTLVDVGSGIGSFLFNIDGYRTINAYVISDALFSTTQRGFTLELSFAITAGIGSGTETGAFFNFESYFDPSKYVQGSVLCSTSDLLTTGGLPWIGGVDQVHLLRAPVMGPYVRASVFNEDGIAHNVEVQAYLST